MIEYPLSENEQLMTPIRRQNTVDPKFGSTASTNYSLNNFSSEKKGLVNAFVTESEASFWGSTTHTGNLPKAKRSNADRFIPKRACPNLQIAFSRLHEEVIEESSELIKSGEKGDESNEGNTRNILRSYLRKEVLGYPPSTGNGSSFVNKNLFQFSDPQETEGLPLGLRETGYSVVQQLDQPMTSIRKIPKIPFKVLDAPALQDDFYLNLLDWSDSNLLSVGLSSCVYLWSATNGKVFKVCDLGNDDMVTSVNWSKSGDNLAVGTNQGEVHIWDINKVKKIRTFEGHSGRIGALAWGQNCLISGSRDKTILLRDVRSNSHYYERLFAHKQEVCGLKWSTDDQMFCSGGNDNKLFVWTPKSTQPIFKSNHHKAAVKALAWSPHQHGLLASGGGTADKCIRFWNASLGKQVDVVDTGSQVCNLLFSKNSNELISTHGYTKNQIHLWNYPEMKKLVTLTGHTFRVLYLAMSPDGNTIVTGAGDETLRFWDLSSSRSTPKTLSLTKKGLSQAMMLR